MKLWVLRKSNQIHWSTPKITNHCHCTSTAQWAESTMGKWLFAFIIYFGLMDTADLESNSFSSHRRTDWCPWPTCVFPLHTPSYESWFPREFSPKSVAALVPPQLYIFSQTPACRLPNQPPILPVAAVDNTFPTSRDRRKAQEMPLDFPSPHLNNHRFQPRVQVDYNLKLSWLVAQWEVYSVDALGMPLEMP